MPILTRSPRKIVLAVLIFIVLGWLICSWIGNHQLHNAKVLLEQAGPAELELHARYGFTHSRCGSDFVTVIFWQRGPRIPERQGYVCGGLFHPSEIQIVPFDEGLIQGLVDV